MKHALARIAGVRMDFGREKTLPKLYRNLENIG
jgi:hypothetical protein